MKHLWIVIIILGFVVDCLAQVNWSYEIDEYMTTSCWGTSATMCHINENEESYINGMKRNGSVTFLNNENQICFFENLGFRAI